MSLYPITNYSTIRDLKVNNLNIQDNYKLPILPITSGDAPIHQKGSLAMDTVTNNLYISNGVEWTVVTGSGGTPSLTTITTSTTIESPSGNYIIDTTNGPLTITLSNGILGDIINLSLKFKNGEPATIITENGTFQLSSLFNTQELVFSNSGWLLNNSFYPTTQVDKLIGSGSSGYAAQGIGIAVSSDGTTLAVGGYNDGDGIGAVWIWNRVNEEYIQAENKLVGTGNIGSSIQGMYVSLSGDGNTLAVGGPGDNNSVGATWIFMRENNDQPFTQFQKLIGTGNIGPSQQGFNLSLSSDGTTLAVGGYNDNNRIGAVWIFTRATVDQPFSQLNDKLIGSDSVGYAGQGYGISLSSDGNTLAVGGPFDTDYNGAVWIFTRASPGQSYSQFEDKLIGIGNTGTASQGYSVSLSGDGNTLAVGGPGDNTSVGATWIFTRASPGQSYSQLNNKLIGTGNIGSSYQGNRVFISADSNILAIAGPSDNQDTGATWVFIKSNDEYIQLNEKLVGALSFNAYQGASIALSSNGNILAIGGPNDNNNTGASWIFERSGSGSGTFEEFAQVFETVGSGAYQGKSVALSNDGSILAIGAPGVDTTAGAVWVWSKDENSYSIIQKLSDDTLPANAAQGSSVAVSANGNIVIYGGTGYNENQGAVWVWRFDGEGGYTQEQIITDVTAAASYQGTCVAISDDSNIIAYGGPGNFGTGCVWVWRYIEGSFFQAQKIFDAAATSARQGQSISLSYDGTIIAYGGAEDASFRGAVWIWTDTAGTFSQTQKLTDTDYTGTYQGTSVALNSDGSVVAYGGNAYSSNRGAVWIWTENEGTYTKTQIITDVSVPVNTYQGWSVDISSDGNTVVYGAPFDTSQQGASWVWNKIEGTYIQTQKIFAIANSAFQGESIALTPDGNTLAVGGDHYSSNTGAVWVYDKGAIPTYSELQKIVTTNTSGPTNAGYSVATSRNGNVVAIGGPGNNAGRGTVWIWVKDSEGNYSNNQTIQSDTISGLGISLAISETGDILLIGGPLTDNNVGAVWLWTRNVNGTFVETLKMNDPTATNAGQGFSVAISSNGDVIAFGGTGDNDGVGAVWIWGRSGEIYSYIQKLVSGDQTVSEGSSVALSSDGRIVAYGAPRDNSSQGAVYIWTRPENSNVYTQLQKITDDTGTGALQGSSVSLSADGNILAVGGPGDNNNTGAVWLWTRNGTYNNSGRISDNSLANSEQGKSVSISADGNTIVYGAIGDQEGEGAVYVWTRGGYTNKIVATNDTERALQGFSVTLTSTGNILVFGGINDTAGKGAAWVYK